MKNNRHIVEIQQFTIEAIMELFRLANEFKDGIFNDGCDTLSDMIFCSLFYEPSTRTRLSFESAALRLGGKIIGTENAREFSSAAKGETLEDTIQVISKYCRAIILRHYEAGAAKRAAMVSSVPIINAGDGVGQHPTQALLDAFTIWSKIGRIDNLTIQCVGDLANGRTVRSLVYLLSKFPNNRFVFTSPDLIKMQPDILDYLRRHNVAFQEGKVIDQNCDVLYVTRIQKERFPDPSVYDSVFGYYVINNEMADSLPQQAIIMHPLPRINEIAVEVDDNPRAVYFEQANNGLYVRMALLQLIFDDRWNLLPIAA
jgi:aspartate carbamoyltransferase catalytic subunit